jgi:hypothetical protein
MPSAMPAVSNQPGAPICRSNSSNGCLSRLAEAPASLRPWLGLDRQGLLEALADHFIPLRQQWGIWLIAASLALVVV